MFSRCFGGCLISRPRRRKPEAGNRNPAAKPEVGNRSLTAEIEACKKEIGIHFFYKTELRFSFERRLLRKAQIFGKRRSLMAEIEACKKQTDDGAIAKW